MNYDTPSYLDKTYEERAEEVKALSGAGDRVLVGFFGALIFGYSYRLV